MKVIALQMFNDLKAKTLRNEGDIFEVDPDRYAEIMAKRTDLVQPYEAPEDKATGEGDEAPEDKATGEGDEAPEDKATGEGDEAHEDKATGEGDEAHEDKATGEGADSVKKPAAKSTRKPSKAKSSK